MTHAAATGPLASIDLSDNDAFVDRVPYEWFDALRRDDPVHWQPERHGRGFWAVTAHADVVAVSKDWATFSSQTGASALEDLAPSASQPITGSGTSGLFRTAGDALPRQQLQHSRRLRTLRLRTDLHHQTHRGSPNPAHCRLVA